MLEIVLTLTKYLAKFSLFFIVVRSKKTFARDYDIRAFIGISSAGKISKTAKNYSLLCYKKAKLRTIVP